MVFKIKICMYYKYQYKFTFNSSVAEAVIIQYFSIIAVDDMYH